MLLLLGAENTQILKRWQDLLSGEHHLEHASSMAAVKKQISFRNFDLILLHRLIVNDGNLLEIRRLAPATRLFLLSDQPHHEEGLAFIKLGIVGYANTYISAELLAEAVHVITSGGVWLGQKVIQQLILDAHNKSPEKDTSVIAARLTVLTRTERRVAELVARGETNLEIAADLDIAERTVKAHLTSIYDKLGVGNRLSLALLMSQGGVR
jgi:DNA-binding NarL/FixJ family response regulator